MPSRLAVAVRVHRARRRSVGRMFACRARIPSTVLSASSGSFDHQVELGPVAGRQRHDLLDVGHAVEVTQQSQLAREPRSAPAARGRQRGAVLWETPIASSSLTPRAPGAVGWSAAQLAS